MSSTEQKYWPEKGRIVVVDKIPDCNFCATLGQSVPGPYDFATSMGPWANGCETHWKQYRVGDLGTGSGQLWITEDQVAPERLSAAPMTLGAVLNHKRERSGS